jgi:hypothetical protein
MCLPEGVVGFWMRRAAMATLLGVTSLRTATLCLTASLLWVATSWATRADGQRARVESADVGEECTLALDQPSTQRASAQPASEQRVAMEIEPAPRASPPARPGRTLGGRALRGRALGALDRAQCEQQLRDAAIPFEPLAATPDVDQPLRLRGPIQGGFVIRQHGREPRVVRGRLQRDTRLDAIFDCRLVVALETWSAWAREAGFVGVEHVSVFRRHSRVAATGRPSGHASAMAIDVLALIRADGSRFTILDDWARRERGADPCATREETEEQARVRELACRGVREGLFQVVITPHHDDRHANHLHLEVRPDVDWAIVR